MIMTREEYVSCLNKIKESYYKIVDDSTKLNATEAFLALLVNLELIKARYELGKENNDDDTL